MTGASGWRDSPLRYGRMSRLLHWLCAALLIWQFAVVGAYQVLGASPLLNRIAGLGPSHGVVGLCVLALVVLRTLWLWRNRGRRPGHPGSLGRMAAAVHLVFYALMFVIPALGLLRAYGSGKGWAYGPVQIVPATGAEVPWMIALADAAHGELAWLLCALILGHVAMVGVHRFWLRDGILARMAGRAV